MTTEEMLAGFRELAEELVKTIEAKNHDYAKGADPFKNLRRHTCYGIVVRMDDKISRLDTMTNPAHGNPVMRVKDESFEDTNKDLAAYALLNILLHRELKARQTEGYTKVILNK